MSGEYTNEEAMLPQPLVFVVVINVMSFPLHMFYCLSLCFLLLFSNKTIQQCLAYIMIFIYFSFLVKCAVLGNADTETKEEFFEFNV